MIQEEVHIINAYFQIFKTGVSIIINYYIFIHSHKKKNNLKLNLNYYMKIALVAMLMQ